MFTDPILKKLIKKHKAPTWTDRSEFLFEDMVDTIISQQLSGKAATSIFNRFKQLFQEQTNIEMQKTPNQTKTFPLPKDVLAIGEGSIKKIGVSHAKAKYILNVAQAFVDKEIVTKKIKTMTDEEVITTLTKIKGIGKWSAEMILIFTLNRPDVFSIGDLGLRNAIKNLYGIENTEEIRTLTEKWKPHRSLASWYLWRSLENT